MGKRHQPGTPTVPEFRIDPFARLRADRLAPPRPVQPRPPSPPPPAPTLSAADARLREELASEATRPLLVLRLERRAHGRVATVLRGFPPSDLPTMLAFLDALHQDLGIRPVLQEDTVHVDGDHRVSLSEWLPRHGFRVQA